MGGQEAKRVACTAGAGHPEYGPDPAGAAAADSGPEDGPDRAGAAADDPTPWPASGLAQQDLPAALYVVATPIGNAADISLRALWVLRRADIVAAEDTRVSAPLLARYGIRTRLWAVHQHNEAGAVAPLLERLAAGQRVALVTDAGTPGVSDPGALLVRAVLAAGLRVVPVPGASSLTAILSVAGVLTTDIRWVGFLSSRARERERQLRTLAAGGQATVLLEAPHRIEATAGALAAALPPQRRIVVGRELTKKFESVVATTASGLVQALAESGGRGEFVLVIDAPEAPAGASLPDEEAELDATTLAWLEALRSELPAARAAALAARATGLPRERLYRALTAGGAGNATLPPRGG